MNTFFRPIDCIFYSFFLQHCNDRQYYVSNLCRCECTDKNQVKHKSFFLLFHAKGFPKNKERNCHDKIWCSLVKKLITWLTDKKILWPSLIMLSSVIFCLLLYWMICDSRYVFKTKYLYIRCQLGFFPSFPHEMPNVIWYFKQLLIKGHIH